MFQFLETIGQDIRSDIFFGIGEFSKVFLPLEHQIPNDEQGPLVSEYRHAEADWAAGP